MKLQEIFDQLTSGEFSQLSIGGQSAGVINESNWSRVLNHVNLGLTELYKRFNIKMGQVKVELIEDQTTYRLHSDYSKHSLRLPGVTKFIDDAADDRFADDILKIVQVKTAESQEMGLNDRLNKWSVMTPSMQTIQVPKDIANASADLPDALKTESLDLIYRASPQKIVVRVGYFDPNRVDVELPDLYLTPLLYFIASRVHNPIGMTNEFHAGNNYAAMYERACQRIETEGLEIDDGAQNHKLRMKGFV